MTHRRRLERVDIAERHPGISQDGAGSLTEAARVALARHNTSPTSVGVIDGQTEDGLELEWMAPDDRSRAFWSDGARATEWAAEAVAIVAVEALRGLVVVSRAARGSHVDYFIGAPGDGLQNARGLEVAGIDRGSLAALLASKRDQARRNPERLPAIAVAVRFEEPHVMMDDA